VERNLATVGPAVDALRDWLRARGVAGGEALEKVALATTEALTNAIRHGGGGAEDFRVRLAWSWRGGEVEIEVSEPGSFAPGADWSALPEDPLAEGGRGGFLITELMDAVEHRNSGGRHALRVRARLDAQEGAGLIALEQALDAMTEDLGNAYETISALFGLAEDLATAPELRLMAEKSLARLRPLLGADAAWVRLATDDGKLRRLAADGAASGPADLPLTSSGMEARVAREGVEHTLPNRAELPPEDPLHAAGGCAFVCPFSFEGRLRGVLTATRESEPGRFFSAGQTGLARTLADFLGIACANADLQTQRRSREQARRELEIASQIQRALLPQSIAPHPGWTVAGVCAQAAEVGGDFFDVIDRPDGERLLVIADVMGKGVPAALMAATLRTAIRTLAPHLSGPGELLTRVNRQLCQDLDRIDMFITAQVLWLGVGDSPARLASAGHCSPLVLDVEGRASWWSAPGGLPVGVLADEIYEESHHAVADDDRVWLMTDGAIELEDESGEQIGPEGLARLAATASSP
jgi:anti-sigma regulatory factor (Ser/Thr protein kinase)